MVLIFLSACTVFVYSQLPISIDQAIENGNRYLASRFTKGTRATVVFIKAENSELGEFILRKLNVLLVNNGWLTIVERNQSALDTITREMNYQMSGNVSEATELSIGKQLGAEVIITGELAKSGSNWRLDIQALRVESAQIDGQWFAENIRSDPSWASLVSSKNVTVSFSGDELTMRDKQTIIDGLRNAIQQTKTAMEIDENPSNQTGHNFTITIHQNKLSTGVIQAEITVAFFRSGRVVLSSETYYITEMNNTQLVRRIAERIRGDKAFFNKVNEAIR
jgi:hypothetical protein